jgi:hypothetical protein
MAPLLLCAIAGHSDSPANLRKHSFSIPGCIDDCSPLGISPSIAEYSPFSSRSENHSLLSAARLPQISAHDRWGDVTRLVVVGSPLVRPMTR